MNEKELVEQLLLTPKEIGNLKPVETTAGWQIKDFWKPDAILFKVINEAQLHKALNTPITREVECPYCEGTGLIGGAAINDRCDDCNRTGKLSKTFTIKEAIERMME